MELNEILNNQVEHYKDLTNYYHLLLRDVLDGKQGIRLIEEQFIESFGFTNKRKSIMTQWTKEGFFDTPGGRHRLIKYTLRYSFDNNELHVIGHETGGEESSLFEGIISRACEFYTLMGQLGIKKDIEGER